MSSSSHQAMSLCNRLLNALHDVANVIVRDVWTSRQAEAYLEEVLFDAVGVERCTGIYRLLMHRLPHRTALDLLAQHEPMELRVQRHKLA